MVQFHTRRNAFLNNNDEIYEVVMIAGQSGPSVYVPKGNLNTATDAFGRLRVGSPHTLFDNSFRYNDNTEKWNQKITGTGTVTHNADQGLIDLTIGTAENDEIIRETSRVFQYQPGKSLLSLNTFSMGTAQENVRMRIGYYGKENGIYFERDGEELYIVKRSAVSGSIVETRVPQSQWNTNKLDGLSIISPNFNSDRSHIFWTDFEWLGVGSVRTGFVINGQFIICHIFHHANHIEGTYMTTATLPIRYEVKNTGASTGATLKQICSTVISEGGYSALSLARGASTALTGKNLTQIRFRPLINIRLKSGRTDGVVIPTEAMVYGLQQAAFKFAIIKGSSVNSPSWESLDDLSDVEYDISADSINTIGTIVKEGIFVGDTKGGSTIINLMDMNHSLQLSRGIIDSDSAGDILTLAAISTTNNDDAVGSISWQEH